MFIRENEINDNYKHYIPDNLKSLFHSNFIVLDIETTGFSRINASIILIGLLIKTENKLVTKQIFSETLKEEKLILKKLVEILDSMSHYFFITYNGHSFDLPFINAKLRQHRIDYQLNLNNNFDLYRLIRRNKNCLNLKRHNLKSIEKFLKIKRQDTISGKESIQLYYDYLEVKNKTLLEKILLHNFEDIKYLLPLLKILDYFSYNQIMTFYPKKIDNYYYFSQLKIHNNFITIHLTGFSNDTIHYYDEFCTIKSNKDHNALVIKIVLKEFLIDDVLYQLMNHKVFYSDPFNTLSPSAKNNLIVSIQNELQFDKIILNTKKILRKYNIKKVPTDS